VRNLLEGSALPPSGRSPDGHRSRGRNPGTIEENFPASSRLEEDGEKASQTPDDLFNWILKRGMNLTWIIHKIVANKTYLSENSKGEIEKSYEE
jgi:hypothetical protein